MGQERASVAGVKANGTTPATREEAVAAGLQNAKDVGGREVVNGIVAVDTPALGREVQVGKHGLRHGLNGKEERQRLNRLANAHIGELLKKAVLVDGWTDQENPKAHINALCAVLNTKEGNALVSILAKDNTWDKRTVIESVSVTSLYSVNAKAEPLTRPYERPQTGSASDTFTVAYLRERWQERFGRDLAKKRAEHELKAVRKCYKDTDQWMKTPNGRPTKLTERQWLQVRTPSFKAWFGDWENDPANASKVVDENGEPLVVYHGRWRDFHIFSDRVPGAKNSMAPYGTAWFTPNKQAAKHFGDSAIEPLACFLNLRKPHVVDAKGQTWDDIEGEGGTDYIAEDVIRQRLGDGAIIRNVTEGEGTTLDDYVVLTDNGGNANIKSAIDNTGTFSPENPDIRSSIGGGYLDDWSVRAQEAFNRGMKTEAQIAEQLGIPYGAWMTNRPFGSLGEDAITGVLDENGRDIRTSDLLDFQSEWHHVGKRFDEVLFLDPDQFYDVRSANEIDDKQDAALFFYYTKMRQAPREIDARKLTAEERDALNLQERDIWKAFDEKVTPARDSFVRAVAANAEVGTLRTLASAYEKAMREHKRLADDVAKQFLASIGKPRAYRNERPRKVGGARSSIAGGTAIPSTKFTIAEARQAIRNQNKAHPNGCTNRQTGHVAFINGRQINEMTNEGGMAKTKNNGFSFYEHLHAVAHAPTLYEGATLVRDDPDTKHGDPHVRILRYAAPIVIERPDGPIEATAWLTVKTSEQHGNRVYSLEVLELEEARQRSANTASSALPRARNLTDTIAYPPEEVNQENADDLRGKLHNVMRRGGRGAVRPLVRPPGGAPEGRKKSAPLLIR